MKKRRGEVPFFYRDTRSMRVAAFYPKLRRRLSTAQPRTTRRALEACIIAVEDFSDPIAQASAAAELHGLVSADVGRTSPPPPAAVRRKHSGVGLFAGRCSARWSICG